MSKRLRQDGMEIKLDRKWWIISDDNSYSLATKQTDNKGVTRLIGQYHYATLTQLYKAYVNRILRTRKTNSMQEVIEVLREVESMLEEKLEGW